VTWRPLSRAGRFATSHRCSRPGPLLIPVSLTSSRAPLADGRRRAISGSLVNRTALPFLATATYVRVHTLPDGHVDFDTADRFLLDTDSKALHVLNGVHPVAVFAPGPMVLRRDEQNPGRCATRRARHGLRSRWCATSLGWSRWCETGWVRWVPIW
jgi:hypothetical protein